jgi:hypothetical protein
MEPYSLVTHFVMSESISFFSLRRRYEVVNMSALRPLSRDCIEWGWSFRLKSGVVCLPSSYGKFRHAAPPVVDVEAVGLFSMMLRTASRCCNRRDVNLHEHVE